MLWPPSTSSNHEIEATLSLPIQLTGLAEDYTLAGNNVPVAVIRGYNYPRGEGSVSDLMRNPESDLFR